MADTTYRSGQWLGIVRAGAVIVLEAGTSPDAVDALWDYLGTDTPTIHGVLNAVTSHFRTELTGMPPFGILVTSDRLHAILRGGMSLAVQTGGTADTVSGRDVTTWSERSLALPDSLILTFDGGQPDAAAPPELPVGEAVVLMSELRRGVRVTELPEADSAAQLQAPAGLGAAVAGQDADRAVASGAPASRVLGPAAASAAVSAVVLGSAVSAAPAQGSVTPLSEGGNGTDSGEAVDGIATAPDGDSAASRNGDPEATVHGSPTSNDEAGTPGEAEGSAGEFGISDGPAAADPEGEAAGSGEGNESGTEAGTEAGSADIGQSPETGDEDAYAGFAMAADAEWNAELDEPSRSEQDAVDPVVQEAASRSHAEPLEAGTEADDDLGQTLYPGSSHDGGPAATDQSGTSDGEAAGNPNVEPGDLHLEPGSPALEPGNPDAEPGVAESAEIGNTTNYDHLFGATELRSVEDAAIRFDENGHQIPKDGEGPAAGNIPPQPNLPPAAGQSSGPTGQGSPEDGNSSDVHGGSADAAEASDVSGEAPAWQPPSGLLIDSVPWGNSGTGRNPPATQGGASHPTGASGAAEAESALDPDGVDTDHDGHTVMRSELAGCDVGGGAPAAEPLESRPPTGPMVLARLCPEGHANPPSRSQCSECGAAIDSEPREVGRPRLGRMHVSTGEVLDLDHSLVIGRQPSVSRVMGGVMPRLVQVHSGSGDISRSHVEVRLDGWDVLLVDLKATNGTVLVREGQSPRRLGQGEQAILLNGDIAELGDGVSLLFEGLL